MIGDKSITILCQNCKLDVTFPNILVNRKKHYHNCPRCGCGIFNTWNDLYADQGQPNKTAPTYQEGVNANMDKRNSGFKLNSTLRFS